MLRRLPKRLPADHFQPAFFIPNGTQPSDFTATLEAEGKQPANGELLRDHSDEAKKVWLFAWRSGGEWQTEAEGRGVRGHAHLVWFAMNDSSGTQTTAKRVQLIVAYKGVVVFRSAPRCISDAQKPVSTRAGIAEDDATAEDEAEEADEEEEVAA